MEAKVFASGNLGSNAKVVNFKNGNAVIQFSIATHNYYYNKDGELIQQSTWHECKKYVKKINQNLIDALVKGAHISVFGVLKYEEFDKAVTKVKNVKIKRAFIEVKELDIE